MSGRSLDSLRIWSVSHLSMSWVMNNVNFHYEERVVGCLSILLYRVRNICDSMKTIVKVFSTKYFLFYFQVKFQIIFLILHFYSTCYIEVHQLMCYFLLMGLCEFRIIFYCYRLNFQIQISLFHFCFYFTRFECDFLNLFIGLIFHCLFRQDVTS